MATLKSQSMAELLSNKPEDQSVKQFCFDNNLTEARYYYWRRRLSGIDNEQNEKGFIAVKVNPSLGLGNPVATLEFPTGARLAIYDPAVLPNLKALL